MIAAAREALGGEKKLAAVKTIVATGRTRQVRGDNLVPIEFEIAYRAARQVRPQGRDSRAGKRTDDSRASAARTLLQVSGAFAAAGARRRPAAADGGTGGRGRRGCVSATVKQDFARLMLGMFAGSSPALPLTFSYVGKAEAPQGKADVLDVKGPPGPGAFAARLFINADTHLPIMLTWTAPAPPMRGGPPPRRLAVTVRPPATTQGAPAQPSPPETRLYFGEYREVSGLQLPFRLRRALGADTVEETTFDGYKINAQDRSQEVRGPEMTRASRMLFGLLFCMAGAASLFAQAPPRDGRLLVTVVDQTRAVIPGATVTVSALDDAAKSAAREPVKTSDQGVATMTLPPGRYLVMAEFPGFDPGVLKEVRIRAGDNRQTIVLAIQGFQDSVTVGRDKQEAAADRAAARSARRSRAIRWTRSRTIPTEMAQQLQDMTGGGR